MCEAKRRQALPKSLECDEVVPDSDLECDEEMLDEEDAPQTPLTTINMSFLSRNYATMAIGATPSTPHSVVRSDPFDEYKSQICANLFKKQSGIMIKPLSEFATRINAAQRRLVIDWLIDLSVNPDMKSRPETLFLAVNIFDRFLAQRPVHKKYFQLYGVVSLWIAVQYEEKNDKVTVLMLHKNMDYAYPIEAIKPAYRQVLTELAFEFTVPTVDKFMYHIQHCFLPNDLSEQKVLCEYVLSASLMEAEITLKYAPSTIASATALLVRRVFHLTLNPGNSSDTLAEYNCVRLPSEPSSPEEFTACTAALVDCTLAHLDVLHESKERLSPIHQNMTALNEKYRDKISEDVTTHVCGRLYDYI